VIGAGVLYIYHIIEPPELPVITAVVLAADLVCEDERGRFVEVDVDTAEFEDCEELLYAVTFEEREGRKPGFYTALIAGFDNGHRTDVLMVVSLDVINREAHVVAIPRDTRVNVSRSVKRINGAFNDGGGRNNFERGIAQVQREVAMVIGFVPDYYVAVDMRAVETLINTVGGVEIDVPFNMRYTDPVEGLNINLTAGRQTLDGRNAVHFARFRMGNNRADTITDWQRILHQQMILTALWEKMSKPESMWLLPSYIQIFNRNVRTDLRVGELLWLAIESRGVSLDFHMVPVRGQIEEPYWSALLDVRGVAELVNSTINPLLTDIEWTSLGLP
jgi:LCP family protein required for cell wall assembly